MPCPPPMPGRCCLQCLLSCLRNLGASSVSCMFPRMRFSVAPTMRDNCLIGSCAQQATHSPCCGSHGPTICQTYHCMLGIVPSQTAVISCRGRAGGAAGQARQHPLNFCAHPEKPTSDRPRELHGGTNDSSTLNLHKHGQISSSRPFWDPQN